MKSYEPGTPIPRPEDFRAGHYTQMVWKAIGAGKAIIQESERKGWRVVVCDYDPPGNVAGEKPYCGGEGRPRRSLVRDLKSLNRRSSRSTRPAWPLRGHL